MSFCGSSREALSVETGALANECFVDVLNIIPHSVFFLISVSILVAWRHSLFGKLNIVTWVHFQGHTLRWVISLLLLCVNIVEVGEGALLALQDSHGLLKYHVFIPQCVATISTGLSLAYYHNVEMWNSPRFLILLLLYWSSSLTCKVLKLLSITTDGVNVNDVRFWLTVLVISLYSILLLIELNVLRLQRYTFFKKKNLLQPLDEIADTRFIYSYVNFLSKATFWWLLGLLREGYKHVLELPQLGRLPDTEHTKTNMVKLYRAFEEEKVRAETAGREPSLTRSYLKTFWPMLTLAASYKLLGDLLGFVGPWFIEAIVDYAYLARRSQITTPNVTNSTTGDRFVSVDSFFSNGYVLSAVLFLTCLLQKSFLQNHHFLVIREAIRLRNAVQGLVYDKALRLSTLMLTSDKLSTGQILNHMSTDAYFLHNLFFMLHYIWAVPVQMTIAFVLMYLKLGISAVLGALVVLLVLPFQYLVARQLSKLQKKILHYSDERMKKTTELVQGIRALKLFTWEKMFCGRVEEVRAQEMKFIFQHSILLALMDFITMGTPIAGMLITFSLYTMVEEEPMTAGRVFSTVALFNVFLLPLFTFTLVLHCIVNARVSAKRLVPYLTAPEVEGLKLHDEYLASEGVQVDTDDGDDRVELGHDLHVRFHLGSGKYQTTSRKTSEGSYKGLNSDTERHSSDSQLHVGSNRTRKFSAPSRMMTATEAGKRKEVSPKRKASAVKSNEIVAIDNGDKSHQSSNSSVDKNELLPLVNSDTKPPMMVSSSVSTEDMSEIAVADTVVEVRHSVEIKDGNFTWDVDSEKPFLKNISVKVPVGKLTVVIGQVGSGKSSLVSALLGEMITVSGTVDWCRGTKIAYVAQKPWILNTTLRNNILNGKPFVWKKYKRVIRACALNADIEMLPAGDMTEIGEKGVNLSGGQKQRVTIARALYSDANTVLLDDPLSALDTQVGKQVFNMAITRRLVNKKHTVILVTHGVQYLCRAHHIIVMKDGEVQHEGRLGDIKKADPDLYESWRHSLREAKKKEEDEQKHREPSEHEASTAGVSDTEQVKLEVDDTSRRASVQSTLGTRLLGVASGRQLSKLSVMTEASSDDDEAFDHGDSAAGQLIKEEQKESGSVSWRVYLSFLRACSLWLVTLLLILKVVKQGLAVTADFWLSLWAGRVDTADSGLDTVTSPNTTGQQTRQELSSEETSHYLRVYFILCVVAVLLTLVTAVTEQFVVVLAARRLHLGLLRNIILSPIRFFDTTPSGRILNRFSTDTATIDLRIGQRFSHLTHASLRCISGVIVITVSTPYFLLLIAPLTVLYIIVQKFYLTTSRELQRLDSVTKSPVFSHFSETLNGLQTIRAYGHQGIFLSKAFGHIDDNTVPYLFLHSVNRLMGVFLDYMGSLIVFAAAVFTLTAAVYGATDPAFIGMSVAYALLMCDSLNWVIRCAADVELQMNAVERIQEYSELPQEPYQSSGYTAILPDENWPSGGEICFTEVSARYSEELEPVLRGLCFTIRPGEKVGLCGRTGSGKTSLTSSLFRILDIFEGNITVDGKDISKVPLTQLRAAITAIPQDPLLFTGTVRYNLDPEGVRADEEIWKALDLAQLKDTVGSIPEKLDSIITEGGENFSVGQRQLFCFARALLRRSQILVLDEATASVDTATDGLIQDVIAKGFTDKTVITVAHRISTIETCDRVMVLDDGELVEFDSPATLLGNQDSVFYRLARHHKL